MEVATADVERRLRQPFTLVLLPTRQELTLRTAVFSDTLRDRQQADLTGGVEFGRKASGLLELRRSWFVRYNRPVYYQPKEFHKTLRRAVHILVPSGKTPDFMGDLRDLLRRLQAPRPRVVPMCHQCLGELRLTVLTKRNAVHTSETDVLCTTCAQKELRTEIRSMGLSLSKRMLAQLDRQLLRVRSLPRLLETIQPGFDPTRAPDLTLVDTLEAEAPVRRIGVHELALPDEFKELLVAEGLETLLPVQSKAVAAGLLKGKGLLIVSSTSSGKTLLAEIAGVPRAMAGRKMLYLAPLVALTNEKYELFRARYRRLGLRVGIRVGMSRLDVGDEAKIIVDTDVSRSDIICATYEALDFILRSGDGAQLGEVGTIVVDEIQNLADSERGPELDGLLLRLRHHAPEAQVLALSATVGSPRQLAKELGLTLVEHVGRPVPLERHLVLARTDEEKRELIMRLVREEFRAVSSHGKRGQSIVFTYSRRRAQQLADWLREHRVSAAVYHGGLSYAQRRSVERAFLKQRYACVVTTAALGAGVDFPASQVIFESLAMGREWLTIAEFEQMLGRAGRLGKHDRGRVYLIVQPDRKYHAGQDKTEDEVAGELLSGVVEDVVPSADLERSAEQVLATICSTKVADLKEVARMYRRMLSPTVPPSEALKHLVRTRMVTVGDGTVGPTALGRATALSFLTPGQGLRVLRLTSEMPVLDIAVLLEPFENVYLSSKLQGEVNAAFKTHMPTRLFSGVFADLTDLRTRHSGAARLPGWVFEVLGRWASDFFNCGCPLSPECEHPKLALGRWIVARREEGYTPSGIARLLHEEYELWAYPGDLLSWLDTLVHNLQAVQRIADVVGKVDLTQEVEGQIARIERPLDSGPRGRP